MTRIESLVLKQRAIGTEPSPRENGNFEIAARLRWGIYGDKSQLPPSDSKEVSEILVFIQEEFKEDVRWFSLKRGSLEAMERLKTVALKDPEVFLLEEDEALRVVITDSSRLDKEYLPDYSLCSKVYELGQNSQTYMVVLEQRTGRQPNAKVHLVGLAFVKTGSWIIYL